MARKPKYTSEQIAAAILMRKQGFTLAEIVKRLGFASDMPVRYYTNPAYRERALTQMKKYQATNREAILEQKKESRSNNKEKIRTQKLRYYQANS